jgi:shikimate kinase
MQESSGYQWFPCELKVSKISLCCSAIVLTGPPGSGKTSTGLLLAEKLSWSFTDTDRLIEEQGGLSVNEIFQGQGETHFRLLETKALKLLVDQAPDGAVIATGGGIMTQPGNYELMCRLGKVVALTARVETLVFRLAKDASRPLLHSAAGGKSTPDAANEHALKERLTALIDSRADLYSLPEHRLATDGHSPEEVATQIIELFRLC